MNSKDRFFSFFEINQIWILSAKLKSKMRGSEATPDKKVNSG